MPIKLLSIFIRMFCIDIFRRNIWTNLSTVRPAYLPPKDVLLPDPAQLINHSEAPGPGTYDASQERKHN